MNEIYFARLVSQLGYLGSLLKRASTAGFCPLKVKTIPDLQNLSGNKICILEKGYEQKKI